MASNYDMAVGGGLFDDEGREGRKSSKDKLAAKISTVRAAKKLREDNRWDARWSDFIQMYSNQYPYAELEDYGDIVVPNMMFSTVNVIIPSIAITAPKITVTARRSQDQDSASVAEAVVNHQWKEWNVQDEVRQAVKDFVVIGHGWLEVTWEYKTERVKVPQEEWQEMVREALMQRQQALETSAVSEDNFPTPQEIADGIPKTRDEVVKDAPKVSRVSPFDMFVDPDTTRLQDARWIAKRSFVPIETARENKLWDAGVRKKLKASVLSDARDTVEVMSGGGGADQKSKEAGFVIVYEFYDLVNEEVCAFAEGCDDYLMKPDKSPFPEVHPFVFMQNYEVPERFYPIGDIETVYGLQLELAMTRTQMVNDRKAGRRINMVRSASIGVDGMDALVGGDDQVIIDVLEDRPFSDVFATVNPVGLDSNWYNQSDMIVNDINTITGVSEYARGTPQHIRRTATEAGLIQDAANARSADKLYKVEQMMGNVAGRMIRLSQVFMDTEGVARVVSEDQVVSWVPYDAMALQGEFVFDVEAGSTQPQNETFRRQAALQLMDTMAPFLGSGLLNEPKLIEHILRNGFGIKSVEDFIAPPPMGPEGMPMGPEGEMGMPPGMPPGMPLM